MKNFIIVALCALCFVLLSKNCGRQNDKIIERTDTLTVVQIDTLTRIDIKYVDRWRTRTDTVIHIEKGDTIYVPIPVDRYVFTDDSTYRAEMSGYNVTLDKMDVYRKTITNNITTERLIKPKPKRWGVGIQAGYGINTSGQLRPYIGIGISFNVIRF